MYYHYYCSCIYYYSYCLMLNSLILKLRSLFFTSYLLRISMNNIIVKKLYRSSDLIGLVYNFKSLIILRTEILALISEYLLNSHFYPNILSFSSPNIIYSLLMSLLFNYRTSLFKIQSIYVVSIMLEFW